mmetsp:Transcript_9563/g.18033  ORF Transcript_9563/g.18033 Transcript_9563/m.18033 type:complete len:696 (-) Transcript_9563:916-3003(-)
MEFTSNCERVSQRRLELFFSPLSTEELFDDIEKTNEDSPREFQALSKRGFFKNIKPEQKWDRMVQVLTKHFLFSGTTLEHVQKIAETMILYCPEQGEQVIIEGEPGNFMYVVETGTLRVTCNRSGMDVVDILGADRVFGELALLYNSPRAATVTVDSPNTRLWCLSRSKLRQIENSVMSDNIDRRAQQLKQIPAFERLRNDTIRRAAAVMQEESFESGTVICTEGEVLERGVNDKFYMIAQGSVGVEVSLGGILANMEILKLANSNKTQNKKVVARLQKGQWFGEMALLSDDPRSATVVTEEHTVCYTLTKSAFAQIVSNDKGVIRHITSEAELRKENNHETLFRHERSDVASAVSSLDALDIRHPIGEGAYSIVRLATVRVADRDEVKSGDEVGFALKTMSKQDLLVRNQITHVNHEREILEKSSHPFILSLIKTFQNHDHIFMLFELLQGGELFSLVVGSNGGLPYNQARFYAACVTEGLAYLHRKHIVYRDLKLENLVVDSEGYVKIIDFGFAKELKLKGETSQTLCGTPDYLAPEAVKRSGHSFQVDCWSLGVVIYEMLTQCSPYGDQANSGNQMAVFRRIIQGRKFVDWGQLARVCGGASSEKFLMLKDVLYMLWDPNPHTRMTCANLKEPHEIFKGISFNDLRAKEITAPWIPKVADTTDTSHFDVEQFRNAKESNLRFEGSQDVFKDF